MTKARRADHTDLYQLAEAQAGYFTAAQAQHAGFTREGLRANTNRSLYQNVGHGIYRLARFPASPHEDLFIAWLRAGKHAVISHYSALTLYALSDALPAEVHVTVSRTSSRRRIGIKQHTTRLMPSDVTRWEGLPVTTVERTLIDVARAGMQEWLIAQAVAQAQQRGLIQSSGLLKRAEVTSKRVRDIMHRALAAQETQS